MAGRIYPVTYERILKKYAKFFGDGENEAPMLFFLSMAGARIARLALLARLIRFYQQHISLRLISSCRYYPSCSRYFLEAVGRYGIVRGCGKGFLRIIRCNPLSPGGYDPVVNPPIIPALKERSLLRGLL